MSSLRDESFARRAAAERPRERLAFLGAESLADEELLALVMGSGACTPSARRLLDWAGGPSGLRRTGLGELCRIPGIGPARAAQIKAALELGRRALLHEPLYGHQVRSPADVAQLLRAELAHGEQEALHVFGLDARHRIRCRHMAALGQVDRVQVSAADVFRPLVREGMAAALVAHNHPSGEPGPSVHDEQLTLRLQAVGQMLGIPLLDHVVVARGGYYSFSEHGFLEPMAVHPGRAAARSNCPPRASPAGPLAR
ncbi:MAG: DNA repair protein RadC [Myxococcales bacterium]|nr:DNA repair protein RadC [Myxococcota bacterium]MDW8281100.1 DNA repair protein RadC [Myxococcales bacterium]